MASVVRHIHTSGLAQGDGGDGAVLVFVPGWFEIAEAIKLLGQCDVARELVLFPLHSRMPTAEQQARAVKRTATSPTPAEIHPAEPTRDGGAAELDLR